MAAEDLSRLIDDEKSALRALLKRAIDEACHAPRPKGRNSMRPLAFFPFVLALGALILASRPAAHAEDSRQEGPIDIDKCQTISQPGSYKLINNLTFKGPANSACLSITANFVTLDLAGFTITGISQNDQQPRAAIEADGNTTGITVRNGSISGAGFTVGVNLGGDGSLVEGLHVSNATARWAAVLGSTSCLRAQRSRGKVMPPGRLVDSSIHWSSSNSTPAPLRRFSRASAMNRPATPRCPSEG